MSIVLLFIKDTSWKVTHFLEREMICPQHFYNILQQILNDKLLLVVIIGVKKVILVLGLNLNQ